MKRLPLLPTLIVAAAAAAMIGLGMWQLERAAWKDRLLADYALAATMPALDLDPLLVGGRATPQLAFRRVLVTCRAEAAVPDWRGGRSRTGQGGYVARIPCRPGAGGLAGRITINAGWAPIPDRDRRIALNGIVAGTFGADVEGEPLLLTAATPAESLAAAAPARIEDVPNNHRAYAAQWFFFAGVAVLIYLLALRRRRRELPTEP
jgi:cytochrome oxidase assembly protein ShyY1